ncbi:MAG: hypothetical protein U9R43_06790 [Thermodesulfobacteriota bacterium]|nr:hypothetical protein [Thermodesulfobacteriota bacterium]
MRQKLEAKGRSSSPACRGVAKGEAWKGRSLSPERTLIKAAGRS